MHGRNRIFRSSALLAGLAPGTVPIALWRDALTAPPRRGGLHPNVFFGLAERAAVPLIVSAP